ncbi:hypothetical protein EC844_12562 [Acinetobacter calcoaceticus]|uniref:Uncharacterized protein n=1 Tax=Acinetobacter calcoaceticus TaxID=471 RepID=A0A4R1XF07_ACICA|nr:hypothetical protein EC844_12562 [Acinetobacter calcoaceticus]
MSIQVRVIAVDNQKYTATVEAFDGAQRILKSSVGFKTASKTSIESAIKKSLKTFNRPSFGGMEIIFLCRMGEIS